MIEDRNIICLASNWAYDPTSKHQVMKLLAQRNHVIWVNYHGSRRPRLGHADAGAAVAKIRQFIQGPRRVERNLTVLTPLVVPLPGNRAVAAVNRQLLARQIWNVLRDLPERPAQLWSFAPDVDYLCGRFDEECVVYYCVDEFSEFTGYDAAAIAAAEHRLIRRADLVITTARSLYESKRDVAPDPANVVLVPHGVDYDHFALATSPNTTIPDDLAALPRPILGFWGLIQDWLDLDLLAEVARARPNWSIVLIGEALTDTAVLSALPNVHLLGRRPYASLPAYAKGFDVGLIPFRLNALTLAVNPIKLREYLSAGLPVVSTPLPEVQRYPDSVRLAGDVPDFIAACEHTLNTDAAERRHLAAARQAAMQRETWVEKVKEISGYVRTHTAPGRRGRSRVQP